jgi:predicted lipoprotein with Yx(FWY)xxD motif
LTKGEEFTLREFSLFVIRTNGDVLGVKWGRAGKRIYAEDERDGDGDGDGDVAWEVNG